MEDPKRKGNAFTKTGVIYASILFLSTAAGAALASTTLPERGKIRPIDLSLVVVLSTSPIEEMQDCARRISSGEYHSDFRPFGAVTLQLSNGIPQVIEVGVNVAGPKSTFPSLRVFNFTVTPKLLGESALVTLEIKVGEKRFTHSLSMRPSESRMLEVLSSKGKTIYLICENRTKSK